MTTCPHCGKVIALIFALHDCRPTPNFKRQKAAKKRARAALAKARAEGKQS